MHIYAYNEASASAKALALGLGIKRIKHEGSKFKGAAHKTLINWGCSQLTPELMKCNVVNKPADVKLASDKLSFFELCKEYNEGDYQPDSAVNIPEFTTDRSEALRWIDDGVTVVARLKLNGHSGEGIVILDPKEVDEVIDAPLYVKYIPKKDEYRIHVMGDEVVDVQRKARNREVEDVNWQVRNHANGFIFVRGDAAPPPSVLDQSVLAVNVCGLDFGAVDIIWNEHQQKAYVLEINTAPGLTGSTLEGYVERFKQLM